MSDKKPVRVLTSRVVRERLGECSRATLWRYTQGPDPILVKPLQLGPRRICWLESDVEAAIAKLIRRGSAASAISTDSASAK